MELETIWSMASKTVCDSLNTKMPVSWLGRGQNSLATWVKAGLMEEKFVYKRITMALGNSL